MLIRVPDEKERPRWGSEPLSHGVTGSVIRAEFRGIRRSGSPVPGRSVVGVNRVVIAALGVGALAMVLSACAFAPQPTVTRLPPGIVDASPTPVVTATAPSVVPVEPPATSSPAPSATSGGNASDGDLVTCAEGESRSISGSERAVRVEGSCAQLSVSGNALTIDATAASIQTLSIAGDRVRVDAAAITALSVQGNDASVTSAAAIGSIDLSGDRTQVTAVGAIASVAIRGQDNVVRAGGGVGDTTIEGRDNQVG
ncbi:MAG: hypothetical protein K0S37_3560 [Microbacterium sp.]|nr:hypothetical protein [Microbacterium sp.]